MNRTSKSSSRKAWRHYAGAIHVHTDRSGSLGGLEEVVAAARASELDFVILTDHGTRGYGQENLEGWYDGVLVLCGEEVLAPDGHLLALETREDVGKCGSVEDAVEEIHRQAGLAVAAHCQLSLERKGPLVPPAIDLAKVDALEIWNFFDEFLLRSGGRGFMQATIRPERFLVGPSRRLLNRWDIELGRRPMPAFGGLNAHQRKYPLLDWREVFPWEVSFATLQTTILTKELPAVALRARDMVWQALREGRSYITNRNIGSSRGFEFFWRSAQDKVLSMGAEGEYEPGGRIHVKLPAEGEICIRHNAQPLFWGTGEEISFPAPTPGSYRVEVRLNRRLWILSNAIRLTVDNRPVQPTVSDFT